MIIFLLLILLGVDKIVARYDHSHWLRFLSLSSLCLSIAVYIDSRALKKIARKQTAIQGETLK
ncbi:MAG: hypothetical protein KTR20_13840 [Cellvibrionaceae bacterium]|nr:hypothetical protein [Cellvibrionaceae bacterium]